MSSYQFSPAPDLSTKEQNYATWENGFSDSELSTIRKLGDSSAVANATIVDPTQLNDQIRKSKVSWFPLTTETNFLYDRLAFVARQLNGQFFDFDLYGFVEDFQYTVYQGDTADGDHYTWHMDKGNLNSAPRKLSLVLQLSDPTEYDGGDLQFMCGGEIVTAERKQGLIYAFPSWLLHRVTPTTRGTRKSLVVWIAGPKFK
jgi:PKHD-type hydroxylase